MTTLKSMLKSYTHTHREISICFNLTDSRLSVQRHLIMELCFSILLRDSYRACRAITEFERRSKQW